MGTDSVVYSTALAPVDHFGIGSIRSQARQLFPASALRPLGAGFAAPQSDPRTLSRGGAHGVKSGSRIVIPRHLDLAATRYEVDVSTSDTSSQAIDFHRADNASWAPEIDLGQPKNRNRLNRRAAAADIWETVGSLATDRVLGLGTVTTRETRGQDA
jgi:hypothetical protein